MLRQRQGDAQKDIFRGGLVASGSCVTVMVGAGQCLETMYLVSHTFEFVPSGTEDTWAALLLLKTCELHGSPPDCGTGTGLLQENEEQKGRGQL